MLSFKTFELLCTSLIEFNAAFPIKQNILLLYVIMSFDNLYLFKLYVWIKYKFCLENIFENVHGRD